MAWGLLVLSSVSLAVILEVARLNFASPYEFATPRKIAEGIGEVPYQYRFLIPTISLVLTKYFPIFTLDGYCFVIDIFSCLCVVYCALRMFLFFRVPLVITLKK